MAHGGKELVIGGKLTFLDGAEVVGFPLTREAPGPTLAVADSEATSVAALRADFNALLDVLRKAGLIAAADEGSDPA